MWIAKLRLKHDCIIGNRCVKFNIVMQSLDLNEEVMKGKVLTSSIHQLVGSKKDIKAFVEDLKKDTRVDYIELNGETLFLIERTNKKPVSKFTRKMFFLKPVIIDSCGLEHWEIASHKKDELINFIRAVKPLTDEFVLQSITNTSLENVYFPKVMPQLTALQKQALETAISEGYYLAPKKVSLRELAARTGVSLSTFQKHLQKAESKVMPDIISYLK